MNILAIDTSTKIFSLAVSKDALILASQDIELDKVLSSSIIPSIDAIFKKAKIPFSKIDGFAVGLGPGSFTSLRVGLSTIKGFCLASAKPMVGICSLDLIALNVAGSKSDICVLTDAKRNMVYAAVFSKIADGLRRKTKYLLVEMKDLLPKIKNETIFIGDGLGLYKSVIQEYCIKKSLNVHFEDEQKWLPRATSLCLLAAERFAAKKTDDYNKIVPIYLYPEDCQVRP
ncbi:MAG: tRNA (adenosine(37)-N6)-threonylcarbamoyltransferase complex dimerization subunit type 1 TsaB [Candidatus Omnitrophica bacterium]|nr:tRNA (adenosine(37)-N6)-threonylcarbamoyltransferase complex dimerization subunit type 1 TsaB [Candidatus Omnitrophota bacterium]